MAKLKVVKVIVDTGVFFETGQVDVRKRKDEDGNVTEEVTRLTKKFRYKEVIRGVPEHEALRLEDAHLVAIIGDDESETDAPSTVRKPDKPGRGPAPSVDELTK